MKYLIYPILYFISLFPFPLIYIFSWIIYFFVRYIIKYRSEIILNNLKHSFPDKSLKDLKKIRNKFYRNYSEITVETIKILLISKKQLIRMIAIEENDDFDKLLSSERGAIILTGHLGNFELAGQLFGLKLQHPVFPAYKPMKNKAIDDIIHRIRTRYETKYTPIKSILKTLLENIDSGIYIVFLNDQSPTRGSAHAWFEFLNQETRFFTTPEKFAIKYNLPVYFIKMNRIKQGRYLLTSEIISENPQEEKEHAITEKYVKKLEAAIRSNPNGWLWSHRRWKGGKTTDDS